MGPLPYGPDRETAAERNPRAEVLKPHVITSAVDGFFVQYRCCCVMLSQLCYDECSEARTGKSAQVLFRP